MSIFIRKELFHILNVRASALPRLLLLYGGSVNSQNARDYVSLKEIDGALVGGASLKVTEFRKMIAAAGDHKK